MVLINLSLSALFNLLLIAVILVASMSDQHIWVHTNDVELCVLTNTKASDCLPLPNPTFTNQLSTLTTVEIGLKPTESFTTTNTTQVDLESGGFVTDDDDHSLSSEEANKVHNLPKTTTAVKPKCSNYIITPQNSTCQSHC